MNRRQALATLASTLPAMAVGASAARPSKKGWAGGNPRLHKLVGANWYYTWSPKTRPSKAIEFVPMIKGEWSLRQAGAIKTMGGIFHLFGFNEPERSKQGNVSVARALELWPKLAELAAAKNLRLGSLAPSTHPCERGVGRVVGIEIPLRLVAPLQPGAMRGDERVGEKKQLPGSNAAHRLH